MKIKNPLIIFGILFISTSFISSMSIDFYSPSNNLTPLIQLYYLIFDKPFYNWNIYLSNSESRVEINTNDCRKIELIGEEEIKKYLQCELQEQSTEKCLTHKELNRGSYFIE